MHRGDWEDTKKDAARKRRPGRGEILFSAFEFAFDFFDKEGALGVGSEKAIIEILGHIQVGIDIGTVDHLDDEGLGCAVIADLVEERGVDGYHIHLGGEGDACENHQRNK